LSRAARLEPVPEMRIRWYDLKTPPSAEENSGSDEMIRKTIGSEGADPIFREPSLLCAIIANLLDSQAGSPLLNTGRANIFYTSVKGAILPTAIYWGGDRFRLWHVRTYGTPESKGRPHNPTGRIFMPMH